ncbi:tetratricopeptide repeat protein [Azospirillum sp. TSH100]|uniref:tetratricopeptide repeat protein n=1 Tax=Azospirillum sp. TSH100 TaxID=652764 RepID=UPI000D645744|nr:tetratricopeptide repeat protein [Azospirillum sp. TSH100]QCG90147.1 tetratricopeptide repeat protein [Azospirillum sp. TSH100]
MGMDLAQIIRSHQQGDLPQAEEGYRAYLADTPADARGHLQALQMLSLLLMQTRRPAEAAGHFRRVVEAQTDSPDQWANYASLLRGAGRLDEAERACRRALALAPSHGAGAYNLANLLAAPPPAGAGSPLEAAIWYQRILATVPDHKQARNNLEVLRRKEAGRLEDAARRAVALDPQSVRGHDALARLLQYRSGLLDWTPGKAMTLDLDLAVKAFDHLRRVQTIHLDEPGSLRLWLALALDLFQLGALDDRRLSWAARAAWRRLRSDPKDALAASLVGYLVYRRGRLTLASKLQMRFASRFTDTELDGAGELGSWSMLRADDAFFETLPSLDSVIARLPEMTILADLPEGSDPVIMVSGDEQYVRRFAPDLLRSICQSSPGASIVLNVVAPTPSLLGMLGEWRRLYPLSIGLSAEQPDMTGWSQPQRVTYYACARFIRVQQWHRHLVRPLILVDLDATTRSDLRMLAGDMAGFDLGVLHDRRRRGPFREITVCFVYYNDTPLAGHYLETLAAYIGHFLLDGRPRWMLDQTAHLAVLDWFGRHRPDLRIHRYDFQTFPHCAFIGEK